MMGNVLTDTEKRIANGFDSKGGLLPSNMKAWDIIFVPYLPRVQSTKKRRNNVPITKARPHLKARPLSDVNSRPKAWRRSDYFYPEMIPEPDYSDDAETEPEEFISQENEYEEPSDGKSSEDETQSSSRTSDSEATDASSKTSESFSTSKSSKTDDSISTGRTSTTSDSLGGSPQSQDAVKVKNSTSMGFGSAKSLEVEEEDEELVRPKKPSNPYLEDSERLKLHKELKFQQKHGQSVVKKSELQVAMDKYKEKKLKKGLASQRTSLEKILERQAKKIEMQENQPDTDTPDWMHKLKEQKEQCFDARTDEFYVVHARVVSQSCEYDPPEKAKKKKSPKDGPAHEAP